MLKDSGSIDIVFNTREAEAASGGATLKTSGRDFPGHPTFSPSECFLNPEIRQ